MTPDIPNSGTPTPGGQPEAIAEQYVLDQLTQARASLNRTRIISVITLIAFGVYMTFMTVNFGQFLQPAQAANVASGVIAQQVEDQGPELAAQARQQIPIAIGQIPDLVQQQLPTYRQQLEDQFTTDLTSNLQSTSTQLDTTLTDYLAAHKDEVKQALADGQDSATVHQFGADTTQQFLASLKTTQVNGESVQTKLDNSLSALVAIQKRMDRLANGTNLTPEEKKTRRAIALMGRSISKSVPKAPIATASAL